MLEKLIELKEEFATVFSNRNIKILDSLLPPLVFLLLNRFLGFEYSLIGSILIALIFALARLFKGQRWSYAVGGLGGVLLAVVFTQIIGAEEGFFLPGILSSAITVLLCIASVILNRPLVAFTSHLARRWPLAWYWHEKVLPAYNEVTIGWGLFFALRLFIQVGIFQSNTIEVIAIVQLITSWPFTIGLLIISYLYGIWRLQKLRGPSVEEFNTGIGPPWQGQRRGF
jgi:hypothetical protein